MKHTSIILVVVLSLYSATSLAQEYVIKGNVYAFKDVVLKNINIEAKKAETTAITDSLGNFSIVCFEGDKLVFQGNGFQTTTMKTSKEDLSVKMIFRPGKKNEKMATGYGHISAEDLASSMSQYVSYNNDFANYQDIFTLIQTKFSGVRITSSGATKHLLIRGVNSINSSVLPLYIVDGVTVMDISNVTPFVVEKVNVLKDSDAAIYGSRGSNGVVIINTRRG